MRNCCNHCSSFAPPWHLHFQISLFDDSFQVSRPAEARQLRCDTFTVLNWRAKRDKKNTVVLFLPAESYATRYLLDLNYGPHLQRDKLLTISSATNNWQEPTVAPHRHPSRQHKRHITLLSLLLCCSHSPLKVMTTDKHLQINSSFLFLWSLSKCCNVVFRLSVSFFHHSLYLGSFFWLYRLPPQTAEDSYLSGRLIIWWPAFYKTILSDSSRVKDNK